MTRRATAVVMGAALGCAAGPSSRGSEVPIAGPEVAPPVVPSDVVPSDVVPSAVEPTVATPADTPTTAVDLGPAVRCTRSFNDPIAPATIAAQPAGDVTSWETLRKGIAPGQRLLVEGYAVDWHVCPPCPEGATCKPCESFVVLADSAMAGVKQPLTADLDLWVMSGDPEALGRGVEVRVVIDGCAGRSPVTTGAHVELRGWTAVR